ncbi:Nucleoside-diphosphate-sugar epimerase [Streptosporangium subroseum]|uniref:Nucleoside-diphosphate-sugar epimerase n=2 Tax=Streptosporangium subroseum TaxID=106412 RepID=A0A239NV85_9ACTN|nr:Nucleoside-diphosphate-sugar epimerase [Streptosporangium subroseum]
MVVHRGRTEPDDLVTCTHLHVDRRDFSTVAGQVRAFGPDAVIDTIALTRRDVEAVLPHLPDVHLVVLSSMDVYRAYELYQANDGMPMPVPATEDSPLRLGRYPYRGKGLEMDDYDKLDVEPAYLERGGTVLRLAMIYGPRDPQQREEFVLRRVRAQRKRIPVGPGATLMPRLHVDDAVASVLATLERPGAAAGEVFNITETTTYSINGWMRLIMTAAGHTAELVRVPDDALPADLRSTRATSQHLLASSQKARELLGFRPEDSAAAIARSVRWHLQHPPTNAPTDFTEDDRALACVR